MAENEDDLWGLLETGVRAGRERAERLLRGLVRDGELGRERADELRDRADDLRDRGEEIVEDLMARGRRSTEAMRELIRAEVRKELDAFAARRMEQLKREIRRELEAFANDRRRELSDLIRRAGVLVAELRAAWPEAPAERPPPALNPSPAELAAGPAAGQSAATVDGDQYEAAPAEAVEIDVEVAVLEVIGGAAGEATDGAEAGAGVPEPEPSAPAKAGATDAGTESAARAERASGAKSSGDKAGAQKAGAQKAGAQKAGAGKAGAGKASARKAAAKSVGSEKPGAKRAAGEKAGVGKAGAERPEVGKASAGNGGAGKPEAGPQPDPGSATASSD
ncbi:MAG TPA: hypothetical protein VMD59_24095 [Acidimicrobiales bacterium]|nr:hypothetical protein [Acidimicrobiales bacterium]